MVADKIKPILPTLRERKRYLVFEIISDDTFNKNQVSKSISDSLLNYIGTKGVSKAGILFLEDKYNSNKGIIKVAHKYVDDLKVALMSIKSINKKEVIFKTLGTSGILKKAIQKFG